MSNSDSIKVMVVGRKNDFHAYFAELGHSCSFQVTSVDHSGAALRLLSENKSKFDLLLIDNDITDVDIHTFLKLTANMDLLSIVMHDQENDALVVEAFQNGAFLVLKRPLTIDSVRLIYQDVIRERMHKNAAPEVVIPEDKCFKNRFNSFDSNLVKKSPDNDYNDSNKRTNMEWTPELHEKFLNAINHLGEGRCFPKEILRRMGVSGLTRMQVASHLQKYRNERWRYDDTQRMATYESEFGYMPSIKTPQNDHENGLIIGINPSISGWHPNNQIYCRESNAEPTPYTPFPIGNGVDQSNPHEGFDNAIIEPGFEGFDDLAIFFNNLDDGIGPN